MALYHVRKPHVAQYSRCEVCSIAQQHHSAPSIYMVVLRFLACMHTCFIAEGSLQCGLCEICKEMDKINVVANFENCLVMMPMNT